MNILITAGGTTEKIDSVRGITNFSTGKLGSLIANAFGSNAAVRKIYYVCGKFSILPQSNKAEIIHVGGVSDLENTLREILSRENIDVIIHSMAVSDYRVKSVADGKLSSDLDELVLTLERTPKIISIFAEIAPQSTLVGFKLLDSESIDTLIDRGYEVLMQNKCSFVLANDLRDIKGERHIGYLIDADKNNTRHETKQEIAEAIVTSTLRGKSK